MISSKRGTTIANSTKIEKYTMKHKISNIIYMILWLKRLLVNIRRYKIEVYWNGTFLPSENRIVSAIALRPQRITGERNP
jgi:virulence-associated protein VapD